MSCNNATDPTDKAQAVIAALQARVAELEAACDEFDSRYDAGVQKYRERALVAETRIAQAVARLESVSELRPPSQGMLTAEDAIERALAILKGEA